MVHYRICTLFLAVNEYFYEAEQFRKFLKTWKPGYWAAKTPEEQENYIKHEERYNAKWETVVMMCKLVNVDCDLLLPVVKAVNRWEYNHGKRNRSLEWDFNYRTKDSIRKMLDINDELFDDKHYLSTGREIKA